MNVLIRKFKEDVGMFLEGKRNVVLVTAWLISDNVILDLFARYFKDKMPIILSVDTLHLFPSTLELRDAIKKKYSVEIHEFKPVKCNTRQDFEKLHGKWDEQTDSDFDYRSKVEPLKVGFKSVDKKVTITGRRKDQGSQRVELDVWEPFTDTFNPLADWSWDDVCSYVLMNGIPYNSLHEHVFVSDDPVFPTERDGNAAWKDVHLPGGLPFFAFNEAYLRSLGSWVYVWKSFGDTHTSVQVMVNESERAGRFVGRVNTECGIHTRVSEKRRPHGGKLINLMLSKEEQAKLPEPDHRLALSERQVCDLELLMNGALSPLEGFVTEKEYESIITDYRLPEGHLFGLPVALDTDLEVKIGEHVLLYSDEFGGDLAVLKVESTWIPDKKREAQLCFGTADVAHPSVWHLLTEKKKFYIGGKVFGFNTPKRDWVTCKTPGEVRDMFSEMTENLVAFQCRTSLNLAHKAMFDEVKKELDAIVLVHPIVGPTKSDELPSKTRMLTYKPLEQMEEGIHFEYLPYSMKYGGKKEALQHAIIRKNYGCSHIIIGSNHAGCFNKRTGSDWYEAYDSQNFLLSLEEELAIGVVPFKNMVYVPEKKAFQPIDFVKGKDTKYIDPLSPTQLVKDITEGKEIPPWFTFPEVLKVLQKYVSETK